MNVKDYPRCGVKIHEARTSAGLPVFVFPMEGFRSKYAFFAVKYGGCDRRFRQDGPSAGSAGTGASARRTLR